jgi:NAD+ kinase
MVQTHSGLKTVYIVQNTATDLNNRYRDMLIGFLTSHNVHAVPLTVTLTGCPLLPDPVPDPDLVIVLGGDGTFLRAAQCFGEKQVPLVGINMGHLGFLTRIEADQWEHSLKRLIAGAYTIETRMMLRLDNQPNLALNDIVVKCMNPSHLARLEFFIEDVLAAVYDADGIIIATPTGSTAYSLAAGGPVISPEVEAMSITPICSHSLSAKPIVIPASKRLRVKNAEQNTWNVMVSLDGQECQQMLPGVSVTI